MNGKRYILLCVLCLTGFLLVHAQPRLKNPEFYFGAHGGVSASTVLFDPAQEGMTPITNGCVLGGNGGLVFRYAGHKYCHFQTELNYLHRGWAQNTTEGKTEYSLHYIEWPLLMHLNFGGEVCRWFLNLGPQIGYCIVDEGKHIEHPFDWGLAAGTGLFFKTPNAGVYELEVRFDYSFGGVFGTGLTDYYTTASPMDLSVQFGWYWPIKKSKTKSK